MGSMRGGADLKRAVKFRGFARGSEKREQRVGNGEEEEPPVASIGSADVGRAQAESEANVRGIAEGLFENLRP